jgi:hypothetical protein
MHAVYILMLKEIIFFYIFGEQTKTNVLSIRYSKIYYAKVSQLQYNLIGSEVHLHDINTGY